jgi:hypothetical protein
MRAAALNTLAARAIAGWSAFGFVVWRHFCALLAQNRLA